MKCRLYFGYEPPSGLLALMDKISVFQTPRLARELWNIGEEILRKGKVWSEYSKKGGIESMTRYIPNKGELLDIEHNFIDKKIDSLGFLHVQIKEEQIMAGVPLFEKITIFRGKDRKYINFKEDFEEALDDLLYGKIIGIFKMEGEKEIKFTSFVEDFRKLQS